MQDNDLEENLWRPATADCLSRKTPIPRSLGSTRGSHDALKTLLVTLALLLTLQYRSGQCAGDDTHTLELPKIIVSGVPFEIGVSHPSGSRRPYSLQISKRDRILFEHEGTLPDRIGGVRLPAGGGYLVTLISDGEKWQRPLRSIPGFLTLLPPLTAILVALVFRQVIIALFTGVWIGALFVKDFQPIRSFFYVIDHYTIDALAGEGGGDHVSIAVFTLLLGGMVGVFSRMGGTQGIVDRISAIATNPRRGQLATWLMGVAIFFDDYTNTLIVGNTMRPITDKLRVSREKLSYIVDSTAAPVAAIGIISSWIGFEISLIKDAFDSLGVDRNPLTTFVSSIPYSYYPILTLLFGFTIAFAQRDFGPMLRAERRTRKTGKVLSERAVPISNIDTDIACADGVIPRWYNAAVPIAVVIVGTIAGLVITGTNNLAEAGQANWGLMEAIRASNSFVALLWSSFGGCVVAILLATTQRLLTVTEAMNAWVSGVKSMIMAIIILLLAWGIGAVCGDLHTADYLVGKVSGVLSPRLLPSLIFLVAALVSFATGTSWATMTILTPICIPLVFHVTQQNAAIGGFQESIVLSSIAAILAGSVFGDHCSPISDTTIMSSMASAADHIDHVRTQLPYALTVASTALIVGYLPAAYGVPMPIVLLISCACTVAVVALLARPSNHDSENV